MPDNWMQSSSPGGREEARHGLRSLAAEMTEEEGLDELAEWLEVEGEELHLTRVTQPS